MDVKYFGHRADVEYEAYGRTLEEAFANAASAMMDVMTDIKKVKPSVKREITVSSEDLKSLLYDFLEQLLILHDSENMVFSKVTVKKIRGNRLEAEALGETFDEKRHKSKTVVKAVTYHNMEIGEKGGRCFVHIVLDI